MTIPFELLQRQLSQFLDKVAAGEEMVITRDGRAIARLVPERATNGSGGVPVQAQPRTLGSAKGLIHIADDFDAPLEEFREYME